MEWTIKINNKKDRKILAKLEFSSKVSSNEIKLSGLYLHNGNWTELCNSSCNVDIFINNKELFLKKLYDLYLILCDNIKLLKQVDFKLYEMKYLEIKDIDDN